LTRLDVPVVNISNGAPNIRLPSVFPDDARVGRLAAQYLKELGLQHFACTGPIEFMYSKMRKQAFLAELKTDVSVVHEYTMIRESGADANITGIDFKMLDWLRGLPKPVGIFATSDARASELLQICRFGEIDVPQDVCVLGVDNDELIAALSYPPLSSIELPTEKIGYEAARLLEDLMNGQAPPTRPILFPPVRVVSRQSTNVLAIADSDVVTAVRYIREHVHTGVTVVDILRQVPLNRRYLERKFKNHLGRTPLQEILRVRIERARELLATTDLSMPAIARRSGFPTGEQLATVFRRTTGTTPTLFRQSRQLRD
jgi:LacI family transcriptional regulator